MIRRVGNEVMCALDKSSRLCLNTIYCAHSIDPAFSEEYICAVLNSSVIQNWFKTMFVLTDKLFPYIRKSQLDLIPIKPAPKKVKARIEELVTRITNLREEDSNCDITKESEELDSIINSLYGV